MAETQDWQQERAMIQQRIANVHSQGRCDTCWDLETGAIYTDQCLIYEDERFRVVLDSFPRAVGQTIVVYKPHRADLSELSPEEVGPVFAFCVLLTQAIKAALGAEKVYLVTMCDGPITHLHLQLLPRYPGEYIGSRHFVAERAKLTNGLERAARIRTALLPLLEVVS